MKISPGNLVYTRMDISQTDLLRLEKLMMAALGNTQLEFEWKYKGPLNKSSFTRVIGALQSAGFIQNPDAVEMLDISLDDMRYHLQGKGRVLAFCKSGRIGLNPNATINPLDSVDKKTSVADGVVDLTQTPVRVTLRQEVNVIDSTEIAEFIQRIEDTTTKKYYRYKKRYSLTKPGSFYRVDATVIKSSPTKAASFATSGVIAASETFELEFELINAANVPVQMKSSTRLIHEGVSCMNIVLESLAAEVAEVNLRNKALTEYLKLTSLDISIELACKTPGRYFIGPKNIALELNSLDTIGLEGPAYCVTEKTDGERALMFIDATGVCWRIDNRLNVDATGLRYSTSKCILDGEYVKGTQEDTFYIFDVYHIDGMSILKKPLLGLNGRMNSIDLRAFAQVNRISSGGAAAHPLVVNAKYFEVADQENTIFQRSKDILDRHYAGGSTIAIDGLIFTPIDAPKDLKDLGARTYKWKPPQDNTIDFIVRFDKKAVLQLGEPMRSFVLVQLLVGSKKSRDIIDMIGVITRASTVGDDAYVPRVFETCYLPLEADGTIKTHEVRPESITSGMVVEMGINANLSNIDDRSLSWFPKRIRHDKNEMLARQGGSITGTANDFQVAYKTLQTIENPVTYEMITGKVRYTPDAAQEDVYYTKTLSQAQRQHSPMIALRDFHSWIKGTLLQTFASKKLFDIGVGRAGDLQKWMRAKFDTVMGIDVAANNILGTTKKEDIHDILTMEDCAYRRYQSELARFEQLKQQHKRPTAIPKAMFLIMDAGTLWTNDYIRNLPHKVNRYLAEIAFGVIPSSAINEKILRENWRGIVDKPGFDVVSCQFAVHYFFKDAATLSDFCENVARVLKVGGHFIGTCMDGHRVHTLLSSNDSVSAYQNSTNNTGLLWEIRRGYSVGEFSHSDPSANIGLVITNYIETIGAHIQEYLVDMRLLEAAFAKHNIALVKSELFSDLHNTYKLANPTAIMDDKLLNYSFLNRQFVFKKTR